MVTQDEIENRARQIARNMPDMFPEGFAYYLAEQELNGTTES